MEEVKTEAALVVSNDRREEKATTKSKEMISTKKGFLLKKQLFTPMLFGFLPVNIQEHNSTQKKHRIREIMQKQESKSH